MTKDDIVNQSKQSTSYRTEQYNTDASRDCTLHTLGITFIAIIACMGGTKSGVCIHALVHNDRDVGDLLYLG